ncbi:glycosyltransferase family 2 protein [Alteromonas sp. RKMC-009]|uniref:glycosyltransferase family 2 protein n=1 Tax=Alteromonas sp. RKMC-009 TaxID=2267264 RepID=UPI000E681B3C|nr:glycosyltransferase family A protein [Alteromonas sp. RKMC-009]AYA63002.1 glycosyltransferase family 2 protein [Alteromonas sp. RKMC-009]
MAVKQLTLQIKEYIQSKAAMRSLLKLMRDSGKFDREYYLSTYPDVMQDPTWARKPELHYLKYGASELRNPAPWFETQFYLQQNPDVQEHNINPFVHYILHGAMEGRKPNPKQQKRYLDNSVDKIRYSIVNHLWGGYSKPALRDLEAIYTNEQKDNDLRYFAAWQAARWYYFVDDYKTSLSLGELIDSLGEEYRLGKVAVMNKAYCLMHLGQTEAARKTLQEFLDKKPDDADMLLSISNVQTTEEERLTKINAAFSSHGYASIERIDPSKPLSFANIQASAPKIESEKKVSVIIPTYMTEDRLGIAIQSLLNQSWQNLEIIVVDDCSPDGTYAVAQKFAEQDSRVIPVRQEKNGGAYRARNTGLKLATGDFITTHDGDDWSHPQKIAAQMDFLERNPNVKGVCTHWTRALDNLHFSHNWRLNPRLIHWSHSSFLFRREIVDDVGFWDSVVVGGDTEFIWRIQAKYRRWSVKNIISAVPMAFALDDDGSLTRTKSTHVKTIHNGLRHIYRSGCEWWHKNTSDYYVDDSEKRPFNTAQTMVTRGDTDLDCDVLFIADFSESKDNDVIYEKIKQALSNRRKVGIYHWPVYGEFRENFDARYFNLLMSDLTHPVVYGMNVKANQVIASSPQLFEEELENVASITTSEFTLLSESHTGVEREALESRIESIFSVKPEVELVEQHNV